MTWISQSKAVTGKAPPSARTPGKISLKVFGTVFSTCLFVGHPTETSRQLGGKIKFRGRAAGGDRRALPPSRVAAALAFDPQTLHHQCLYGSWRSSYLNMRSCRRDLYQQWLRNPDRG